jgi:hypothetical protein
MADEARNILERAFGQEKPLTEQERSIRRNAAAFALATFNDNFRDKSRLQRLNVTLTDEQINFAKNFSEVFPRPEDALPESEFNSARNGYDYLVSTPMNEIIPASLDNSISAYDSEKSTAEHKQLLKKDPSGVLYIQSLLARIEDKERHGNFANLQGKEAEFRAKITKMFDQAQIFSDEISEKKPTENQSIEQSLAERVLNVFSGGQKSPRDKFLIGERQNIHGEIPLEFCKPDGKVMPTDSLTAMGARLAFEHYQTAVNTYLNRWGNKT